MITSPTQIPANTGDDCHRQRDAHRTGSTAAWASEDRYDTALCNGEAAKRKAGTQEIHRIIWRRADGLL